MIKLPKSFTVDRATWLRGSVGSLLEDDGRRCCVGFLAKEMGYSDDEMRSMPVLGDVTRTELGLPPELRTCNWSSGDGDIYGANDDDALSDTDREAKLTELFAGIGVEVKFVGAAAEGEKR